MTAVEDAMHRAEGPLNISEADLPALAARTAAEWPSPANYLPKLKDQITAILLAKGYPDPGQSVFHRGTAWRTLAAGDRPEPGEAVSAGWSFIQRNSEPLTPWREAADIYVTIVEVEAALKAVDLPLVFAHGLRLGVAVERFNLRRLHLKAVTRGVKVAKGLRSAAHKTNARHDDSRKARLGRMAELVPEMGVDKAAAQCAFEGLGGMEAIKRQWNRQRRNTDT